MKVYDCDGYKINPGDDGWYTEACTIAVDSAEDIPILADCLYSVGNSEANRLAMYLQDHPKPVVLSYIAASENVTNGPCAKTGWYKTHQLMNEIGIGASLIGGIHEF